jgi:hypothetical protein
MIKERNKVTLPDCSGKNDMEVEMNVSESTSDAVKVTIAGKSAFIKIEDLYGMIFVLCDPEQQMNMMPVRHTTIRKLVRWHTVEVKKDMRKGERLVVKCETDVPMTVEEGLRADVFRKKATRSRFAI